MNSGYKKEPETHRGLDPLQSRTAELGRSLERQVWWRGGGGMLVTGPKSQSWWPLPSADAPNSF